MTDFIRAALPWIVLGIAVAVAAVQISMQKAGRYGEEGKGVPSGGNYMTVGMCLGLCVGCVFGTTGAVPLSDGLSFGMMAGMVIGICIKRKRKRTGQP